MDIKEILQNAGVEIAEDKQESFTKEFRAHYKAVEEYNKKVNSLTTQYNDLNTKYTELTTSNNANDTQLKQLQADNDSLKAQNTQLTNNFNAVSNQFKVFEKGVSKPYIKFVASEVSGLVNENTDFDTAFDDYISKNPQFKESGAIKKVSTTKNFGGDGGSPKSTNQQMNDILLGTLGLK